ncbi:MAG TPA: helix-turn-helix transcriptional regulator [Dehalococcoidia bacterium]|nr:helix-turn-helix transcriptional regulator [Dehalococcoidia bacterium]
MRRGRPPYPELLTPREQQVLELLRQRLTNAQIAQRLGISESGARYHVSEILTKLGVSSREDAARWSGERQVMGAALLIRLRRLPGAARRVATTAPFVLTAVLGLVLASGVVVMSSRQGGGDSAGPAATEDAERAAEIQELLDLADEATQEARLSLPDAELVFVTFARPSGSYTFRFSQPGSQAEISILGPNDPSPGVARWERIVEERPAEIPARRPLDLSKTQNSFAAVAEAAASLSGSSAENMAVMLAYEKGTLMWFPMAVLLPNSLVRCLAPDADLALMRCEPPLPAQGEPPPRVTP